MKITIEVEKQIKSVLNDQFFHQYTDMEFVTDRFYDIAMDASKTINKTALDFYVGAPLLQDILDFCFMWKMDGDKTTYSIVSGKYDVANMMLDYSVALINDETNVVLSGNIGILPAQNSGGLQILDTPIHIQCNGNILSDMPKNSKELYEMGISLRNDSEYGIPIIGIITDSMAVALFKRFVETEIKYVSPKSNANMGNGHRINNGTHTTMKVLTVAWFTQIVSVGGSIVRGHWRCQSCGVDRKDRRVIWISSHSRTPYIRKAQKDILMH